MKNANRFAYALPRQAALVVLASALGASGWSQQQTQPAADPDSAPVATAASQQPSASTYVPPAKEGFWGRANPFARKKWVKKQIDPINDRLSELDQVNAKNARDIKDVDERAQAGIHKAQSAADAANQQANAASEQAGAANSAATQASGHVDAIGNTVNGLDQYKQVTDFDVTFRPGTVNMTAESKQKLDELAGSLTGRDGYILEMDAQAPGAGSAGIQSSEKLAEAVKRYLVTDHQIPVYRMHSVALGNTLVASNTAPGGDESSRPERVRTRAVHVRLMENSLAAPNAATLHSAAPSTGSVQQ